MAALDAAVAAGPDWAAHPPRERGEILRRAFETIIAREDELALLMTLEMGKPLAESKAEVAYGAEFLRWFSEEAVRIDGRYATSPNGQGRLLTMQQPVGPCLLITPWNFPLAMGTRKIGPAIAAGCTMVVKPAQLTPLSMLMLAKILEDAGLPKGVLNLVTATSSGETMGPLIADPRLRKLSFTGSTEVGKKLMAQASDNLLRLSMELGGNAPFIVFDDADVDAAVQGAMIAKMRNIGEACTAANRFHVRESVADEFAEKLAEQARRDEGRPRHRGRRRGRSADRRQPARRRSPSWSTTRSDAAPRRSSAATLATAPATSTTPPCSTDVPDDARLLREEIFGPVAPVKGFADEDEAIAAANDTEYGLVAYVYTSDLQAGAARLRAARDRHGRAQPGHGLQRGRAVRRDQAVGLRPRGRPRGDRGVPRDQVRRRQPVAG